jgi:hypothetical protein
VFPSESTVDPRSTSLGNLLVLHTARITPPERVLFGGFDADLFSRFADSAAYVILNKRGQTADEERTVV